MWKFTLTQLLLCISPQGSGDHGDLTVKENKLTDTEGILGLYSRFKIINIETNGVVYHKTYNLVNYYSQRFSLFCFYVR